MKILIVYAALLIASCDVFSGLPCWEEKSLKSQDFMQWKEDTTIKLFNYSIGDTLDCHGVNIFYKFPFRLVLVGKTLSRDTTTFSFNVDSVYRIGQESRETNGITHCCYWRYGHKIVGSTTAFEVRNSFIFPLISGKYELPVCLTHKYVKLFKHDSVLIEFKGFPQFKYAGLINANSFARGPCNKYHPVVIEIEKNNNGFTFVQLPNEEGSGMIGSCWIKYLPIKKLPK
jgi:hypothetical protein